MRTLRHWLGPGTRLLAHYLEQLRESLETLAERLRASIAHAIGTAVGGLARDALRCALDELVTPGQSPTPAPAWSPYSSRERGLPLGDSEDPADPGSFWTEEMSPQEARARMIQRPALRLQAPQRLAVSVVAGLQAAWVCQRSLRRPALLALVGVGLVVGCVAYAAPAVATAGLVLAGSAGQLGLLAGALQSIGLT